MDCVTIVTVIRDLSVAGAAVTTAFAAVRGLGKWREELTGKVHFDAARQLMRATYALRDQIKQYRNPFYGGHEFPEGHTERKFLELQADDWLYMFNKRWTPLWAALQDFDLYTLEAEALWGSAIRTKTDELRQCVITIRVASEAYIANKRSGGEDFEMNPELAKKMSAAVSSLTLEPDNAVNLAIDDALRGIELELRAHLTRS